MIEAMCQEIKAYPPQKIRTIFIGGGTPSSLSTDNLKKLLDTVYTTFTVDPTIEKTIEMNPESTRLSTLKVLKTYHFNRISLGVQSFIPEELKFLGRAHKSDRVYATVKMLHDEGFPNFNLDLIFGLPNAQLDHLKHSLDIALSLNPTHLSTYALTIEPKTAFKKRRIPTLESDTAKQHFQLIRKTLKANNFRHYEVSAFAKPGFTCQHNLTYWNLNPFIGIGPSAASFFEGRHYQNTANLPLYTQNPTPIIHQKQVPILPQDELLKDFLVANLRRPAGIPVKRLTRRFGENLLAPLAPTIAKLKKNGFLRNRPDRLQVTRKGLFLLDAVLIELV